MATTPPRLPPLLRWHQRHAHAVYCRRHTPLMRDCVRRWRTQGWLMGAGLACAVMWALAASAGHWAEAATLGVAAYAISRVVPDGTWTLVDAEKDRVVAQVARCDGCALMAAADRFTRSCRRCDRIVDWQLAAGTDPEPKIINEE